MMVRPSVCSARKMSHSASRACGIQSDGRLVEEEDLGLVDERARDHQALLLPARQVLDARLAAVAEAHAREDLLGALARHRAREAEVGGVEDQVLQHRQPAVGIGALGHDPDAPAHGHRPRDDVLAGDQRLPTGRQHARGEDADGRGLARAVGAEQTEELAGADRQVEPVERDDRAAGRGSRRRRSRRPGIGPPARAFLSLGAA